MTLLRPVDDEYPLFRLRSDGTVERLGHAVAQPGDTFQIHVTANRPNLTCPPDGGDPGTFPGLPWYLDDLRPQGYLGRAYARHHGHDFGMPLDPDCSEPRSLLKMLSHTGGTRQGDIIPGENALQAALMSREAPPDLVRAATRQQAYPERAAAVMAGTLACLGPGGEQPKFTATVEDDGQSDAVLVKFSRAADGEAARRWADLLVCEHLALQCLRDAGIRAAASELIQTSEYTFLEVQRFDRTPNLLGRLGFVSLMSLSSAFAGDVTAGWGTVGEQLQALDWVTPETAIRMAELHAFGRLIGNTDMHQGNIGFHLADRGPLPLSPAYDMLPMSLAPSRTGVLRATSPMSPVAPLRAGQLAHLQWAAPVAVDYWERVAGSPLLRSTVLRRVAGENARRVRAMGQRFG
ncbi:HipA domain-containing protein [Stenotrophomonas bentonitica]